MGLKYLWDTNTVIYYLQNQFPKEGEKFIDSLLIEYLPVLSIITEMELLCWNSIKQKDEKVIRQFLKHAYILEINKEIKLKAVEIRKNTKIKLPDAIIASTAIVYKLCLLTRNTKDFSRIGSLEVVDPFSI